DDITLWTEQIDVPIGMDPNIFLAREALIKGLKPLDTFLYPDLEIYGKGIGSIPEFIKTDYQLVATESFVKSVRKTFPKEIIAYKWKYRKNQDFDKIIELIRAKSKNSLNNLLFRGIRL